MPISFAILWPDGSIHVTHLNKFRCISESGGIPLNIVPSGRWKSGVETIVSILLFGRGIGTVSATEVEEGLPADKAPRSSGTATQVHRVGAAFPRRIENHTD